MLLIRHRTTGEVIRKLPGRNLDCADLRGLDLREADLPGARDRSLHWRDMVEGLLISPAALFSVSFSAFLLMVSPFLRPEKRMLALRFSGSSLCTLAPLPVLIFAASLAPPLRRWLPLSLVRTDLTGADLSGVVLRKASMTGILLNGTRLEKAVLRECSLGSAELRGARLRGADLTDAMVTHADLRGADLSETQWGRACLVGTDLREADLRGADLSRAEFGMNLPPAQFGTLSYNPEPAQLVGARFDARTRWPGGLDPEEAGALRVD